MRWLVLLIAACSSIPRAQMIADVETQPQTAVLLPPVTFGPVAHPASHYNEPATPIANADHDAIFTALAATAQGKGDPQRDARLDLVGDELATLLAHDGVADAEVVEFALHSHGIVEGMYSLLVSHAATADAAIAELSPQLLDALNVGNVHVGVGGGDHAPFVVAITHTSIVTLPPTVPRALPERGEIAFEATFDAQVHGPRVTLTYDDDRKHPIHPTLQLVDAVTFHTTLACGEHTGTMWFLVEALDAKNVLQHLLLAPIECGGTLADSYRVEPRANTNVAPAELAHRLAAIINRERVAAHVPIVAGDLRADLAAGVETELMRRDASVDHTQIDSTTLQRLRDQGLMATLTLEGTLHAKDLASAAEILLNYPAYREMIGKDGPTHLGISIAFDKAHELYIALELVQIIPVIDTARIEKRMLERIDARRPEFDRTHHPLARDKELDKLAYRYALNRARGWRDLVVTDAVQHDPNFAFGSYGFTRRALTLLLTDDIDKVDIGEDKPFAGVGVAAVQAPRNGALAGRTFVIVIYGTAR